MSIVAISAAYGAGGGRIAREVADRLGVPFVDRGLAVSMAERLDISVDEALEARDPPGPSLLERLLSGFHAAAPAGVPSALPPDVVTPEDLHRASRDVLIAQARTGSGVILGRGACAALRDQAGVLRVRLTGPPERRVAQAQWLGAADRATAQRAMRRMDRAHAEYLRRFYEVSVDAPDLYHLMIDATAFGLDAVVELIVAAARAPIAQ
jgi:cytidylate kinase